MQTSVFVALSVNIDKLKYKLIESLYANYSNQVIREHNFYVICQGYTEAQAKEVKELAPDINFIFTDRITGSISHIRKVLLNRYEFFKNYEYIIIIDDDFKFGAYALAQYDHHIQEMSEHPEVGMLACHRRLKSQLRIQITPIDTVYPQDLAVISMRNGLIIKSNVITPDELFNDRVEYHEEFYMALQVYIKGYEVGKAWVDIYHHSKAGGLGHSLQHKYSTLTTNDAPSSKKIAMEEGLFTADEGSILYSDYDVGRVSDYAHELHDSNKKTLGFM